MEDERASVEVGDPGGGSGGADSIDDEIEP